METATPDALVGLFRPEVTMFGLVKLHNFKDITSVLY